MSYRTQKHRALKLGQKANKSDTEASSNDGLHSSLSMMDISSNMSNVSDVSTDRRDSDIKFTDATKKSSGNTDPDGQPLNREVSANEISMDIDTEAMIADGSRQDNDCIELSEVSNTSVIDIHLSETPSGLEKSWNDDSEGSTWMSDTSEPLEAPNSLENEKTLREKLRDCAIKHVTHITHHFLNDLLSILRSEGHSDLPKTAETLLSTQRTHDRIKLMRTKRGTYGSYMYLGVEAQLQKQLATSGYNDKELRVLVNVDGLPVYSRSRQQMWPILLQILHPDYYCKPAVVALYCGDSKPLDVNEFMNDFVDEVTRLLERGLQAENTLFSFRIAAFVCDTPARAYLKLCKAHTGFCGCERCEVYGKTINCKRVYPEMNCRLRTLNSFIQKRQSEHHLPNGTSPLLRIPGFDPVRGVVLDYMHLCCGVMKALFEKWFSTKKQKGSIGRRDRKLLRELLLLLSSEIPMEFQRKTLDPEDLVNWKATQYRLVLLYVGGVILRKVLSSESYRHFLHFFVGCRILCSRNWALTYTNEAESYLRTFFKGMSTHYGKDSQVMNFHNLIHLADDVRHLEAPLTEYSAFPFENCLGHIKKLIRTPRNPVAQVFRRLSEQEGTPAIIKKCDTGPIDKHRIPRTKQGAETTNIVEYSKIGVKTMTVCITAPDNIVKLANSQIVQVSRIYSNESKKIMLEGQALEKKGDAFKAPMASSKVGIYKIGHAIASTKCFSIDEIVDKCMLLSVKRCKYALTLLHV